MSRAPYMLALLLLIRPALAAAPATAQAAPAPAPAAAPAATQAVPVPASAAAPATTQAPAPAPAPAPAAPASAPAATKAATVPATAHAAPAPVPAQAATEPAPAPAPAARVETAIDLALLHLERRQHADGHFGSDPKLAMTALTLTSYLACGHAPDLGRHGRIVRRSLDYLVKNAPPDGYFGKADGSRMYGQGIIVVALAQAYGLEQDPARRAAMRSVLVRAVAVVLAAQSVKKEPAHAGGWRYEPLSADSDLSVTGWNALALAAARDIGLDIPANAVSDAVAYAARCYRTDSGGFAYQPGGESTAAMTAVGMMTLSLLPAPDRPKLAAGGKFLREHSVTDATRFPYYALYHINQAARDVGGETWAAASRAARDRLLRAQLPSGGWPQSASPEEPGEVYATAMAVLTLSVHSGALPLYQR